MDMQDKEFDDLFRSKLDSFEVDPSANVWPGIASELNQPKKKIALLPFLNVAASIIVLVGAGLLFIPKKTPITSVSHVKTGIAKAVRSENIARAVKVEPSAVLNKDLHRVAAVQNTKVTSGTAAEPADTLTTKPAQPQAIASAQQNQQPAKAVVPDKTIALTTKTAADPMQANTAKLEIAALTLPGVKNDVPTVKTKPRIHSFGDLVNVLVAKVDKRKDKVIEFTADDDGESNITGLNLGIIKIKKGE